MMRNQDEVQRAHDMLHPLVTGEIPIRFVDEHDRERWHVALQVLCWVLGPLHNPERQGAFEGNLEQIERTLAAQGFTLHDGRRN